MPKPLTKQFSPLSLLVVFANLVIALFNVFLYSLIGSSPVHAGQ